MNPVFVLHGVGNRDPQAFAGRVRALQSATRDRWTMHPVFWGDLGADDAWVGLTVPSGDVRASGGGELRAGRPPSLSRQLDVALAAELLAGARPAADGAGDGAGSEDRAEIVALAAIARLAVGDDAGNGLREAPGAFDPARAEAVRQAIHDHWPSTTWLRLVTDSALLHEVGAALAGPLTDPDLGADHPDLYAYAVRSLDAPRRADTGGFVRRRLDEIDRLVGAAVGAVAGRVNAYLRTEQGPGMTRFLGDVLVYQRRREEIHSRVRSVISAVDPALGDRDHPVQVVGHSLGGVIAFDMATADRPLWVRSLVTFGSQAPFFHVCDPRGGRLQPFSGDRPVQLPPSLGAWTNLWEPLDVLAFVAAKVFRPHPGHRLVDLPVPHLASSGLWTHSTYWALPAVAAAIEQGLAA